ncbi:MAG: hypothetical protein SFY68_04805 [Candidatus Sumerlaeia bacterium]|nr:hypothetical protein [Candidatus Sumerlaeia bacterium]
MKPVVRDLLLGATAFVLFLGCIAHQSNFYKDWSQGSGKFIQKVNIPSAEVIKIMAMGYDNAYANWMTLNAIQYFGAAWDTDQQVVEPIYNYFDVLTKLDPHFTKVYELANLVLSDNYGPRENNKGHKLSIQLLRKGNYYNPQEWNIPYLAMYTAIWGLEDDKLAKSFLPVLRRIPSTPDHVLRLEEYIYRKSGRYNIAFDVNLKHYLDYIDRDKVAEQEITMLKLVTILDGWYKTQIAQVAEQYFQDTGKHPTEIEQLISGKYMIEFEAPTYQAVLETLNNHVDDFGDMANMHIALREESTRKIKGLPPHPKGYWYYIDSAAANHANSQPLKEDVAFLDRFFYITSPEFNLDQINSVSIEAQNFVMDYLRKNTVPPSYEEMKQYLVADGFGGHFVYFPEVEGSDGRILPRFYSTSSIRMSRENPNHDPRLGLQGTIDQFPQRPAPFPGMPNYFQPEPSIWDFEEDALWALCQGFAPGIREDAPDNLALFLSFGESDRTYVHCDDHMVLPDMMK